MTVKTQNGKIITKLVGDERRVSCSCCEGEPTCCMYPADELGNLYTAADLPDAVTVNWSGRFTGDMSKSGSGYAASGYTLDEQSGLWVLTDTATSTTRTVGNCLIRGDGGLTDNGDLVEDQFSGSYVVALDDDYVDQYLSSNGLYVYPGDWFYGDTSVKSVVRQSLCQWEESGYPICGTDYQSDQIAATRLRRTLYFNPMDQKWAVSVLIIELLLDGDREYWECGFFNIGGGKNGDQNSPAGEYRDYFGELVATVSES